MVREGCGEPQVKVHERDQWMRRQRKKRSGEENQERVTADEETVMQDAEEVRECAPPSSRLLKAAEGCRCGRQNSRLRLDKGRSCLRSSAGKELALPGSHAPWRQEGAPQPQATVRKPLPVSLGVSMKEEAVEGRSQARSTKAEPTSPVGHQPCS